ncbi:MAG: efflux RND transporter permease subunit [Verrucomicrobia bacterium]|nr:efflux RND transporter permease subunit [Verrucomicrobiota bacterium]
MNFTDLFIRRPVVATVVNLLILIAGYQAWRTLSVRQYPRSDISVITVKTVYVGADADLVQGFVTTPLEQAIAAVDGIDYMESQSAPGLSTITAQLKINYDPFKALAQVQAKVNQVRNDLPPEAELPTIDIMSTDNQFASMYLSFYSNDLDRNQISDYLARVVQPRLSAVSGVQQAQILGERKFAMRIWLKPDRMAALGIAPTDIQRRLGQNNYLSAIGSTKGSMVAVNLKANTDLRSAEEFRQLVIKQSGNAIVRLQDVADVELGAEDYNSDVRFSGSTATFMGIYVLPTANTLDVIRRVRAELPELERQLPVGMKLGVPYDSTDYIQNALQEVTKTLTETVCIVIAVIFLFMGSWRTVLVPVVAIPLSLIGAVFLMLVFGFTLNLLTLLAIVLAVGLVVDDAIVVVENVERHVQKGLTPLEAAYTGARELFGPIVAMTITLVAVYAPIGIQGGLTGALFREFAFTLAGAVAVSGFVALTLSPMMSSRLLKKGMAERGLTGWINRRFDSLKRFYLRLLEGSLSIRPVIITAAVIVILLIVPFYFMSQRELAPREDQGVIFGLVQTSPDSTTDQNVLFSKAVNDVFKSFPETAQTFQLIFPGSQGFGFSGMVGKPWNQRERNMQSLVPEVTRKLSVIPGVRVVTTTPPPLPGGSNFPVEFVIASTVEPRELLDFANQLVAAATKSGKFFFADSDLKIDEPQARVLFDRDKVASMGLNLQSVGGDLAWLLGGNYVNRFSIEGRSYKVIPQIKRVERLTPDQLKDVYVSGPNGQLVQLSTFAKVQTEVAPRSLNRFNQLNSVKIQGAVQAGMEDQALKILETEAAKILPNGYTIDYSGESRQLRREGNAFMTTFVLALILIYLVLAAQFESFRDPLIILLGSVPLALSGALVFSFLGFTTINIYSQVGLITLVGLIAKNGILIVEFANKLQEQGREKRRALVEAAGTRLRPILMTSVATVVGHFPLVLAHGPGAGARNSIGIMLVSGMIIGTFFTLFVVPSIYTLLAKNHQKGRGRQGGEPIGGVERKLQPVLA